MNKEQYVSFGVAQLLKQKGFDWAVLTCYQNSGFRYVNIGNWNKFSASTLCSAPTQQMACRWLREEKDIDIIPFHERLLHDCYWCRIEQNLLTAHQQEPIYSTYEDAVESALKYVLTKVI